MNQQLAAIATGFAELPANIAKSLADIMASSPTTTGPALSNTNSRVVLLPQLDRRNFKNTTHWTPELYNSIRKNKTKKEEEGESGDDEPTPGTSSTSSGSSKEKLSKLSIYMEDENGDPIPETQRNSARHKAKLFWNELLKKGKAPPSGGKVDLHIRDEFVLLMEESFPWLRYCENHWKADRVWINHYPNWYKGAVDTRDIKVKTEAKARANVHAGEAVNVDSDDAGVQDVQEKHTKRRPADESNKTSEPKRRRVDGGEVAPPPPPVAAKRLKVRSFIFPSCMRH